MLVKIERFINRRIYMILDISISGGRMILDMQGKPIEELDDLDLSDVQLTGLESIARERPKIIEAVLPDYDVAARRNVIAYLAALAIGSSHVYADSPNPLFKQMRSLLNRVSSDDLSRRTFLTGGLAGILAACSPFSQTLITRHNDGYDSPKSLHRPTGPHITEQDYPPMNSTILQDIPGDWNQVVKEGSPGNMDIAAKRDGSTKAVPAAIGDVSAAGYNSPIGWYVIMRHGLGFATQYSHMKKVSGRIIKEGIVQRGTILTPEDEIGEAGNTGTLAKGWHHLAFSLKVPPYAEPNNQYTTRNERTGQAATAHSADPARFAEYCVAGKNVDGKRVKICNYSVNYRQGKEYDTATWEKDKEFRRFLGGLRQELSMPVAEFRGLMQSVLYYYHILLIEGKLKKRFDGKLSASRADSYLEKLREFKEFRGPILTAPIKNPYKPELYRG